MLRQLLGKRAIVRSNLGYLHRDAEGNKWHLRSDALISAVTAFNAAHRAIREFPENQSKAVYKWTERRLVFRFCANSDGREAFVAKGFLLKNLRCRIKSYRYGLDESANLLTAAQRGISVPLVHGFGIQYGKSRLPCSNFLLLECLSGYEPIGDLLKQAKDDPAECRALLMRTIPVFVSLYKAGCNHIDIHAETIMLHKDIEKPPKILDFHYARFYDRPNLEVLAFEAGFFSGACLDVLDQDAIGAWLSVLADRIGLRDVAGRRAFLERVIFCQKNGLSRRERMMVGGACHQRGSKAEAF